jgi:hypothetical protein
LVEVLLVLVELLVVVELVEVVLLRGAAIAAWWCSCCGVEELSC